MNINTIFMQLKVEEHDSTINSMNETVTNCNGLKMRAADGRK